MDDARAGDGSRIEAVTLDEAIAAARTDAPRVRARRAEESVRRSEIALPAARWLPRLGATLQAVLGTDNNSAANWLSSGGAVEMPRIAGTGFLQDPSQIVWTPYLTTAVGVGLEQEVLDFGRIDAAQRAADARLDEARAQSDDTVLDAEARAREAYVAVQSAHELLRAAEAAAARSEEIVRATRASAEQGLRPQVDVTRAMADQARFVVAVEHARAGLHVARAQLAAAAGSEALELDASEVAHTDALPSLTASLDALDQAPLVRAAEASATAAHADADEASADLLPELRLVATALGAAGGAPAEGHASPAFGAGGVPFVPNYFAGLVLRWHFFDAQAIARRDVASARADAASADVDVAEDEARIAIEEAWYAARGAEASLDALERARDAAVTSYEQVDARYRAGLASAIEIADAENLRTSAEVALAVGRFTYERARAELTRRTSPGGATRTETHE